MSRVAPRQPDLFAPPEPAPTPEPPRRPPLEELQETLALVRAADRMPWRTLPACMEQEYRVMALAREAGPEGAALMSAIFAETERLFTAAEREGRDL